MKKFLIMACAMCLLIGTANAAEPTKNPDFGKKTGTMKQMPTPEQMQRIRRAHENAFEQRLKLTEVQKLKTRELRKSGHEKMKPVMEQIFAKKQEAEAIRNSKLTVEAQEEKLTAIDKDLAVLEKQANEIRKQNMKDFESILTKSQRKTLNQMKKEGRKNFDKQRKELPPPNHA